MRTPEIRNNVFYYGSKDPDRKIFDQLVHLPYGTSYNSYLVVGSEKTALIDTVYPPKINELISKLKENNIKKLDYIISNHGEQDHSGAIPELLKMYPEAKVVTNAKCKEFLKELLLLEDDVFIVVNDEEKLLLGDKTLRFIMAPWVHWPDTMFTFLEEDKILFSGDFFGSHLADDILYVEDEEKTLDSAKRYYAEIMMPFVRIFKKYFAKIDEIAPEIIGASHGPIYQNPELIINAYKEWASDEPANKAIIISISMYGSTTKMVDYLSKKLEQSGTQVKVYDVMNSDIGELAVDLIDAAGVIVATPMVLSGPHPNIVAWTFLVNALKPQIKYIGIMGSYNWGGLMANKIKNLVEDLRGVDILKPLMVKGHPKQEDYKKLDEFAEQILEKHTKTNTTL